MRHNIILAAVAASLATTSFAQTFTISGTIPGMRRGTRIALRSAEQSRNINFQCLSDNESFTISGTIKSPVLAELCIDEKPAAEYSENEIPNQLGARFMLEGTTYKVSTEHLDSLPLVYSLTKPLLPKAHNIRIMGGEAQWQYSEWAEATYHLRLKSEEVNLQYRMEKYWHDKDKTIDTAKVERLESLVDAAEQKVEEANRYFISNHKNYAISLLLQQKATNKPFAFTLSEYDSLKTAFADNYDKLRFAEYAAEIDRMKQYPKGCTFRDLTISDTKGNVTRLSDMIEKGKWNFIDFWASWCGPCRAAIPEVKNMYEALGQRLNILSLSVDKRENDWRMAMADEQMPWRQFLVPQSEIKQLTEGYYVKYIPSLVVVSPEGHIVLFTNDAKKAHKYLTQQLSL